MGVRLLDQLTADVRDVVMPLLSCIVDNAGIYRNEVLMLRGDGETQYIAEVHNAKHGYHCRQSYSGNIVPILSELGLAVPISHDSFQFLPSALQAYREQSELTDHEVQRRIGEELFRIWKEDPHRHISTQHDVDELTARLGITRQQYFENARILCVLGLAVEGKHAENTLEGGNLDLASPEGVRWAAAGYPPVGEDRSPTVNVTVHITMQQLFQEVERLPIEEADKERIDELFRQFEVERHKSDPSYKPLQDLLSMASSVKELAPLLFRFGAKYVDDIERMAQHVPGL